MSIPCLAVRIATVAALRGRTLVGDFVHDSEIRPIDVLAGVESQPFIVVYTDDVQISPRQGDPLSGTTSFTLVLEFAIAAQMRLNPEQPAELIVPLTDARMEADLDRLAYRIKAVLHTPDNPWSILWRSLVTEIDRIDTGRGASGEKGVRFAARQMQMKVGSLAEPARGVPASGVWADFLTHFEQVDSNYAATIRADIEGDGDNTTTRYRRQHQAQADAEALGHDLAEPAVPIGAAIRIVYETGDFTEDPA